MGDPGVRPFRMVIAGGGGQGTLTLAQIVMEVARRSGSFVLQSEIHGMSQGGGSVHACLTIALSPVSTPVIMEGTGDLLIALEPLEALRYVPLLSADAPMLLARSPVKSVAGYPEDEQLYAALEAIPGREIFEAGPLTRVFRFNQAVGPMWPRSGRGAGGRRGRGSASPARAPGSGSTGGAWSGSRSGCRDSPSARRRSCRCSGCGVRGASAGAPGRSGRPGSTRTAA